MIDTPELAEVARASIAVLVFGIGVALVWFAVKAVIGHILAGKIAAAIRRRRKARKSVEESDGR
jgi:Kef-type K+ transport system membrane component KefB